MKKFSALFVSAFAIIFLFAARGEAQISTTDISSAAGVKWTFQPEGGVWSTILVPDGGWNNQGFHCAAGTYRAVIQIPPHTTDERVLLRFAAVNFGAEVLIGPDETHLTKVADHVDGWVPVTADVTDAVAACRQATIEVQVAGRDKFKVNGRYTVPEGATWCPTLEEGILRGVEVEVVQAVRISDVFIRPSVASESIAADVTIKNDSGSSATVSLSPTLASAGPAAFQYPLFPTTTALIASGSSKILTLGPIHWDLGARSYWWPNVPYRPGYHTQLHVLTLNLKVNGISRPASTTRFGFREFTAKGPHYYLNQIRCNLRGDNLQEANFGTDAYGVRPGFGPPSPGNPGWPQAVANLLKLNFNVLRIHQIPATPYMLDVCDRLGLMLIEESPLRGSEGGEDYAAGKENMLNMDRELVLRDRNHPSTIIWSAANEWGDPIIDANAVIRSVDPTRPIIGDGIGDPGPGYLFTQHYVNGIGGLPTSGAKPLSDRPYGEGEAIWPADNTLQGFAWMATGTLLRRLNGDADIRNYTLNNAWSNFVPGEDPSNEILEKKVKHMGGDLNIQPAIATPWTNPNILLMQNKYNPVAVCDVGFDKLNAISNDRGEWPVLLPRISAGTTVVRHLAIFNDEFSGETVSLKWSANIDRPSGETVGFGALNLRIPFGEFVTQDVSFQAPTTLKAHEVFLTLTAAKNGQIRETESRIAFHVVTGSADLIPNGDYDVTNLASGTDLTVDGDSKQQGALVLGFKLTNAAGQIWHVDNLGNDDITLTNVNSQMALEVYGEKLDKDADVDQWPLHGRDNAVWHVEQAGDEAFVLTNKNSGEALDLYGGRSDEGTRIEQWDVSRATNQQWAFQKIPTAGNQ